jgi:protein-S-isoprenylcysteine O-methyltransferase Ste14
MRNKERSEMMDREKRTSSTAFMPKVLVFLIITTLVIIFAVFILLRAHQLGWTVGWIYVGIVATAFNINLVCLRKWNPDLIERRLRTGKGTKTWDRVWLVLFLIAMITIFVVVNIEARDGVSSAPGVTWLLGFAIFILGWAVVNWSMVLNPFFEKTVRIQTEHGHRVIDTGPYAYVRHPGYVGVSAWIISTPLLLSSNLAFIPAFITVLLFVIRTALEDRMLHNELSGYSDYANRVRFRLIPGVW